MLLCLAALLTAAPPANAATRTNKSATPQRAEVVFVAPENFTDVRDSYTGTDSGRDALLDQIRDYIKDEASRYLATDQKLFVTITDIDMAGDFEPWRGANWDNVRIVKDIYPPRVHL